MLCGYSGKLFYPNGGERFENWVRMSANWFTTDYDAAMHYEKCHTRKTYRSYF